MRRLFPLLFVIGCVSDNGEPPDPNPPGGSCSCDIDFSCSSGCACDTECNDGPGDSPNSADAGSEFDSCSCTASPGAPAGTVTRCSGTSDGCEGFGLPGELACYASSSSGQGNCRFPCSAFQEGTQGDCPSGYTCVPTVEVDAAGNPWHICSF